MESASSPREFRRPPASPVLLVLLVLTRNVGRILAGAIVLALIAGGTALLSTRQFRSSAVVLPEDNAGALSSMALAASQFGVRLPASGSGWTSAVYYSLLRNRAFYQAIAGDTVRVAELGGRRIALTDLLEVEGNHDAERIARLQKRLAQVVTARELKEAGGIEVGIETPWPSVSLALSAAIVNRLEQIALDARQSRASVERQFIDGRVTEARERLNASESRLRAFEEANRVVTAPAVVLQRSRLQRDVVMQQQLYTALLQNQEDLRMRESRDTPTLTVLSRPSLPVLPEPRYVALKAVIGAMGGGMLVLLTLLLREWMQRVRGSASDEVLEVFKALDMLRRKRAA